MFSVPKLPGTYIRPNLYRLVFLRFHKTYKLTIACLLKNSETIHSFIQTDILFTSAQKTCLIIIPTPLNIHRLAYTYKKQCDSVFKVILLRNEQWPQFP